MHTEPFYLSYIPLLIRLQCCESVQLPPYLGSTLHGVVGWKLSEHSPEAYRYLFENRRYGGGKQDIVNPYILEVPRSRRVYQQGDVLDFRILLIGDALRYVGDVVGALTQDAWFELGAQRKKFRMIDIIQGDQLEPIWRLGTLHMDGAIPERLTAWQQEEATRCSIHFLTPLRIRRGGVLIRELDFPTIIRNITRRVEALAERYGGYVNPDAAATVNELSGDVKHTSSGLFWYDLKRYSNRRNTKMDLSGLLGAMTFEGDLTIFAPWLHAARVLHIGRNVTFGCGQVEVGLY